MENWAPGSLRGITYLIFDLQCTHCAALKFLQAKTLTTNFLLTQVKYIRLRGQSNHHTQTYTHFHISGTREKVTSLKQGHVVYKVS